MKKLVKKLEPLLKINEIEDIIIFGSKAKGRNRPEDIDVAVLVRKDNIEIKNRIKNILPDSDIQIITIGDIHKKIFLTLIKEGFSIKKNAYLHNLYGLMPVKIYKYNLKQLTQSQKVMFERGIKTVRGITRLSNSVVLVPIENSSEFDDFLKQWELDIDAKNYELVPFMRKEEI